MFKRLRIIKKQLKRFYEHRFEKIIEINEKYAEPEIKQTPVVKFSLAALKIYLVFIAVLFVYKFITLIL